MTIREEKVARVVSTVEHVRALGRPLPRPTPERLLKDLTEEEKAEVHKRLGD
jgi:hypothetical protein